MNDPNATQFRDLKERASSIKEVLHLFTIAWFAAIGQSLVTGEIPTAKIAELHRLVDRFDHACRLLRNRLTKMIDALDLEGSDRSQPSTGGKNDCNS